MSVRRWNIGKICFSAGIVLISCSVLFLVIWQASAHRNAKRAKDFAETLDMLMPQPQAAVMEPRMDNTMPSLNIGEDDFAAVLDIPAFGASFPMGTSWDNHRAYPCRYDGSVYDGSLVIGATNQKGQLDFAKEITVGHAVYITDMTGNRFAYEVSDIQHSNHVENDLLSTSEADLTIFIKNIYDFEYLIVRCSASGT